MEKRIDLHVHSTCSDGTLSPQELVSYAAEKGLAAFALTDHDTLSGIPAASQAVKKTSLELICGIEFSTVYENQDVHIVGLDVDPDNARLQETIRLQQQERDERNQTIIQKMAADGIPISWEQMRKEFGDICWTRAHFAKFLALHGYVKNMWDAFQTHLGTNCPYYVPRKRLSPMQMTALIRETGGIPVLAHPFQYKLDEEGLYRLAGTLKEHGLIGIEAFYSTHTKEQEEKICTLAHKLSLCLSGGSDFHGANKPGIDLGCGRGNLSIPYELLAKMRGASCSEDASSI